MTLRYDLGLRDSSGPLWHARFFVMTCLASFNGCSGDLRWNVVALLLRALGSAGVFGQRQLSRLAWRVMRRARQGARFAAGLTTADTMVAAAGR